MDVYDEIKEERQRQDQQWGGPSHDDTHNSRDWLCYIAKFRHRISTYTNVRESFIKIAALCIAAVESIDRKYSRTNNDQRTNC